MMKKILILCIFSIVALFSCKDPYEGDTFQVYDLNPIPTYLESRPELFSEWVTVLKYADLYNAINQASEQFTAFVPNNDAVLRYYEKLNVSSIYDLDKEFAVNLAKYHIIHDSLNYDTFIESANNPKGRISIKTLSEDYLRVEYGDGGNENILINNEGLVLELPPIETSNGFVYILGDVLTPLVESLYERIEQNREEYAMFIEILEMTSWKDSLNQIYDEYRLPSGMIQKTKRNYTVLAVPDQSFRNSGINSVSELIKSLETMQYGVPGSNYTAKDNPLFMYTAYHLISGDNEVDDLFSFDNEKKKKLVTTLSRNILQLTQEEDDEFYFNYEAGQDTVAQIIRDRSDVEARNGILHQLDGWLPIWESSSPTEVIWDFCDNPEIAEYIKANETDELKYQTGGPGVEAGIALPSTLGCFNAVYAPNPSTSSSYPTIRYQTCRDETNPNGWTGNLLNNDQFILNLGTNGYIDMTTPALIKGKYKITLRFAYATSQKFIAKATDGSDGGQMRFTFDNDQNVVGRPYTTLEGSDPALGVYDWVMFDEIEFEETSDHTFRITILDPEASSRVKDYRIQLDYLLFEPII